MRHRTTCRYNDALVIRRFLDVGRPGVASRQTSQALYGVIEMSNPRTPEVTQVFQGAAADLASMLAAGDQPGFEALFAEVQT